MRVNSRLSNSNGNVFNCIEIKYALLGCLAFTKREDKLREMLLYVLLCSASIDDKLSGECSIFDIIDHMTCIIGQDYKNHKNHPPAEIFSSLDKDSKMALFKYMNNSGHFDKLSAGNFDPSRASLRSEHSGSKTESNDKLSAGNFDEEDLRIAQQKLAEKLVCEYGDVREMRVFQPRVYLKLLDEYLTFRMNRISVHIAKEIYKTIRR